MIGYDRKKIGKIVALDNPGISVCYFNSMIQALMSCTSFNIKLMEQNNSAMIQEYLRLCMEFDDPKTKAIRIDSAKKLLDLVITARIGNSINLRPGEQEDMHEGMVIFLELLGDRISSLFKIKHRITITCPGCNASHQNINTAFECGIIIDGPKTKKEMEDMILGQRESLNDYRCEKCSHMGVERKTTISRLSDIIVVILNKSRPGIKYFSPQLSFYSEPLARTLEYSVVAQVEHMGDTRGGHYRVLAKRRSPPDMNVARQEEVSGISATVNRELSTLKKRIRMAEEGYKIADAKIKQARLDHLNALKEKYNTLSSQVLRQQAEPATPPPPPPPESVFLFDDSHINWVPDFAPTQHTYIVMYHLQ